MTLIKVWAEIRGMMVFYNGDLQWIRNDARPSKSTLDLVTYLALDDRGSDGRNARIRGEQGFGQQTTR